MNRVVNYKVKDSKDIKDIVYCSAHNCYFVLRPDSSISVNIMIKIYVFEKNFYLNFFL